MKSARKKEIRENKERIINLLQTSVKPIKTGSMSQTLVLKPFKLNRILYFLWGCGAVRYTKKGWIAVPINDYVKQNIVNALGIPKDSEQQKTTTEVGSNVQQKQ